MSQTTVVHIRNAYRTLGARPRRRDDVPQGIDY